ncbi:MAG: MDR/SDR family oxidoreductase, partial [Planctomycetota bacterium]
MGLAETGSFDGLRYARFTPPAPQADQVQLEVRAAGLNFSDVLKAMGLYPGVTDKEPPLGIECCGVVTRVGDQVRRFHPGDRVMGVAPHSLATHAVTGEFALVACPESLSDEQAAATPITFLTAHYALCHLARLSRGERVLIHAAAGGVGQAAIQIAQLAGAEIFATAGSAEKRKLLHSMGIEHVFSTRDLEFADEITRITGGEGVDVVLNSLPGDAIDKSLGILAAYGRFLEIGKTDIYRNRMLGLLPFRNNLSYFAIDLDRMLRQRPREIEQLWNEVVDRFHRGQYQPLPLTSFAAEQAAQAFRYMAQRRNVGKVVVAMKQRESAVASQEAGPPLIRADGAYLVTGGFGALGHRVAQWLADSEAERVALLSRRP